MATMFKAHAVRRSMFLVVVVGAITFVSGRWLRALVILYHALDAALKMGTAEDAGTAHTGHSRGRFALEIQRRRGAPSFERAATRAAATAAAHRHLRSEEDAWLVYVLDVRDGTNDVFVVDRERHRITHHRDVLEGDEVGRCAVDARCSADITPDAIA